MLCVRRGSSADFRPNRPRLPLRPVILIDLGMSLVEVQHLRVGSLPAGKLHLFLCYVALRLTVPVLR
jgi:hypothetical protein